MTGTGTASRGDSRAQSNPIAIVLVFGLVIASTTIIVVAGGSAISATQNQLGAQNAETKMTQLDSQMATVALGSSASQEVALGTSSNYRVNGNAGRITVESSTNGTILETNLGEVIYENDDGQRVAYQGGGVWRAGEGDGSVMVSPPEFHYQGGTLTLPLVTIANNASFNGNAVITRNHTIKKYPNETMENPLSGGTVTVTITSDYHQGWYSYINSRTEGSVKYVGPRTIEVTLTVPVVVKFDYAVGATASTGDPISPDSNFDGPTATGVSAPSIDNVIESKISECKPVSSTSCKDLSAEMSGDNTIEAGTYYADSSYDFGTESKFDTSGGDITVVVNGTTQFKGTKGPNNEDHKITGSNGNVTFHVKNDIDISGNAGVNNDGDSSDLLILVHSNADEIKLAGTDAFNGYIYAPSTNLKLKGGGKNDDNILGGVVVETASASGKASLKHDGPINNPLKFNSAAEITYLHVSENSVNVTAD